MKSIILKKVVYKNNTCVAIHFPYDREMVQRVKEIRGTFFSWSKKCWCVQVRESLIEEIRDKLSRHAFVDTSNLKEIARNQSCELERLEQKLVLKGYSESTITTYRHHFREFLVYYLDREPCDITETEIRHYLYYLIKERRLSRSSQNQAINAIKFYYEKVLNHDRKVYYLERPLKEHRLPGVLSQEEVQSILGSIHNLKHRLMIMMIYGAGLRRSELLQMRISDVCTDRNIVLVSGGKGRKDRQSVLAKSIVSLLKEYLDTYSPKFWLFEGAAGDQYGESSLRQILKRASAKAGIKKTVTLHTLRHSFATHLLESGTSTRYIQVLLGHQSSRTTEIYTHVTRFGLDKIQSPLDRLENQAREADDVASPSSAKME